MQNLYRAPCVLLGGKMEPMRDIAEDHTRSTSKPPRLCVPRCVDASARGVAEPSGQLPRWEQQELFPNQPSEDEACEFSKS